MLFGCYSIYYGHTIIGIQQHKINQATDSAQYAQALHQQQLQADTATAKGKSDFENAALPSLIRFKYNFIAAHRPAPLAELAMGLYDLYPTYYLLNAQSLYVQTLKGEIYNPLQLAAGNFDLSFLIVYLLPLLIITLSYDLMAAEREQGTEKLLRSTGIPLRAVLWYRLLFRLSLVALMINVLCVAAFIVADAHQLMPNILWLLVTCCYVALWFSIMYLLNAFRKASAFNAICALSIWITLLLIIPAGLGLLLSNQQRHSMQLAALMRSRNMPETDEAMYSALAAFYQNHPELKPADTTRAPYFYFQGYSAFLHEGDRKATALVKHYQHQAQLHSKKYQLFNPVNPAVNVQQLFNELAATDLGGELAFKEAVRTFHEQIFWFSNQPLFNNRAMNMDDYRQQPQFILSNQQMNYVNWLINLSLLPISIACLLIIAHHRLKEKFLID